MIFFLIYVFHFLHFSVHTVLRRPSFTVAGTRVTVTTRASKLTGLRTCRTAHSHRTMHTMPRPQRAAPHTQPLTRAAPQLTLPTPQPSRCLQNT